MTRINLVPPDELMDQHLMAEYRELPMVPAALRRSLRTKTKEQVLQSIPQNFTLNKGHVTFFYNKIYYLLCRYEEVKDELLARGFKLSNHRLLGVHTIPQEFFGDYTPTDEALAIIRNRITDRIALKPTWYRKNGKPIYVHD